MEQIRAKTENGSMYILTTDSETDGRYLWGECLKVQADGTQRAFGTVALRQATLQVGESMEMIVPSEQNDTGSYTTASVLAIDRQEIDEAELPVIEALRNLGLEEPHRYGPDELEEFVDRSLAFTRSLRKDNAEDLTR